MIGHLQALLAASWTQGPTFFLPMDDRDMADGVAPDINAVRSPSPFDTRTWTVVGDPIFESSDPPPGAYPGQSYITFDSNDGFTANEFNPYPLRTQAGGWFRPDATPGADVTLLRLGVVGASNAREYRLASDGKFKIVASTGTVILASTTVITPGEWYFVSFVNDTDGSPTGTRLLVNGVVEATGGGAGSGAPNNYAIAGDGYVGAMSAIYWNHQGIAPPDSIYSALYSAAIQSHVNVRQAVLL